MEPPSRTMGTLPSKGPISAASADFAIWLASFASFFQFGYLAQALKRQVIAPSPEYTRSSLASSGQALASAGSFARELSCSARNGRFDGLLVMTNVQPESRVQTRSVGQRWKRILGLRALARCRTLRALFSVRASLTIRSTCSWRV